MVMTIDSFVGLLPEEQYEAYRLVAIAADHFRAEISSARSSMIRADLYSRRLESELLAAGHDLPPRPTVEGRRCE